MLKYLIITSVAMVAMCSIIFKWDMLDYCRPAAEPIRQTNKFRSPSAPIASRKLYNPVQSHISHNIATSSEGSNLLFYYPNIIFSFALIQTGPVTTTSECVASTVNSTHQQHQQQPQQYVVTHIFYDNLFADIRYLALHDRTINYCCWNVKSKNLFAVNMMM